MAALTHADGAGRLRRPVHSLARHRFPLRLLLTVLLLALILALFMTLRGTFDPQARAQAFTQAQAEAARQAELAESIRPVEVFTTAASTLLWTLIPPLLLLATASTGLAIAWRRYGWRESIGAHYLIEAERVRKPRTLTTYGREPAPILRPNQAESPESDEPPTMAELLEQGRVGRGNPLILGYEDGKELTGTWLDLYATINAGLPGSGKTTTQRFFAIQTALHGAAFVIADPHAGAADDSLAATLEPLKSAFLCEPASEPRKILETVRYVADIGEKRIKGQDDPSTFGRRPIILMLDELTRLLVRSDIGPELAELLERIAQEYRKRYVYLSASGQIWTAARTTSELRDSFASVICHRMKRSQARLLLPTEDAATVERLPPGHAVLYRTSGASSVITIPNTTARDVRAVAEILTTGLTTGLTDPTPAHPRFISQPAARIPPDFSEGIPADYPAPGRGEPPSAEAARIVALFLDGKDAGAIVTELTGMTSKRGTPYLQKLAEVQAIIRQALRNTRAAA